MANAIFFTVGGCVPTMADAGRDELIRSLEELPVAAILTELSTHTFVAANDAAAVVFGSPAAKLRGTDVLERIEPHDREAAKAAYKALADKVVDGYHVVRRIVTPDGKVVGVDFWGRRVEGAGKLYGLWLLSPTLGSTTGLDVITLGSSPVVLAVTDHDWQIEYMSSDAHLLGSKGSELRGFPLLGLVHPSAASAFLAAASRTATDHVAVTVFTRIRNGPGRWENRYCLMVPICEYQPPRLGVVISASPSASATVDPPNTLDEQVRHCAVEARAAGVLSILPALTRLPGGSELSARQSEIVVRLVAGERVPDIARSMFLSAATVRNHLSAIYRKFRVHSQAELLAVLLRSATCRP